MTRPVRASRARFLGPKSTGIDDLDAIVRGIGPVIYAFRFGPMIKIGFTEDINRRRIELSAKWSDLLALRVGTRADEEALHRRLAGSVAHGREYYRPTQDVIDELNAA